VHLLSIFRSTGS